NIELYIIQPDGSSLTRLTENGVSDSNASWSPDGRYVVYQSRRDGNSADIYIMNGDGSHSVNLINDPADSPLDDFRPRWSPNGDHIALYTDRFYDPVQDCALHRLAVMSISEGMDSFRPQSTRPGNQETFGWGADGQTIYYTSFCQGREQYEGEFYTWNITTDKVQRFTEDGLIKAAPVWSHNGRYLAYQAAVEGQFDLFIYDSETGETVNLTNHPSQDAQPSWSPDDSQIVFVTDRDGNNEIYIINRDGSELRNISNHPGRDYEPTWSPVP
ncbi:MAG: PD40 domain-containing protein, partial [Anaerolineales bacterium]|nr:PD40 domain-containing protein [Anaerolineales bacterium]